MRPSFVISVCIILSAWILGHAWITTHRSTELIRVTGSAQKQIVSDLITWNGYFSRFASSPKEAFAQLTQDANAIRSYLRGKGIAAKTSSKEKTITAVVYLDFEVD